MPYTNFSTLMNCILVLSGASPNLTATLVVLNAVVILYLSLLLIYYSIANYIPLPMQFELAKATVVR